VKQFTSSTYYFQGNGQAKSTGKNLINILRKIIYDKPRQWHTLLTNALWEYQNTTKYSIGHTLFQILYGEKTIIPVELELTSLRLEL